MSRIYITFCYFIFFLCVFWFNPTQAQFASGADVSWVTEMESAGKKFYNNAGVQQDLFDILKNKCLNAIRLRVWVNPTDGWCNKTDLIAKATRAKNKGFRILLDFHYSDAWADPGQQTKPAAWVSHTISQLTADVTAYTGEVMNALKTAGITPEWVQVGNETNNGILWEEGKASVNMKNFALLVSAGYDEVKAVSPSTKVIVHLSNGFDNSLFRWMFDGLKTNKAKWDVIGMSLYPTPSDWATLTAQCLTNMNDMVLRYNTEVMIVESGMEVGSPATCNAFLTDLIKKVKSVSGGKGLGVFYWEPEAYNGWKGYLLGAFDNTGKPTVAMDAFSNGCTLTGFEEYDTHSISFLYPNPGAGSFMLHPSAFIQQLKMFNLQGDEIFSKSNIDAGVDTCIEPGTSAGIYAVVLQYASGRREILKWVKTH